MNHNIIKFIESIKIEIKEINYNKEDIPMYREINKNIEKKSFSIIISKEKYPIFFCRLYYIDIIIRKKLNIDIKYEIGDVYLYPEYQGKLYKDIKYSNLCFKIILICLEIKNIKKLILWSFDDNIKAIKIYEKFGFIKNNDEKIVKYYNELANKLNYKKNIIIFTLTN